MTMEFSASPAQSEEFAQWLYGLQRSCQQPPLKPRMPLYIGEAHVGSVEEGIAQRLLQQHFFRQEAGQLVLAPDSATMVLQDVALWLRENGLAAKWRDEQLAVLDSAGQTHATVERAVIRTLGMTSVAVHLFGRLADGRIWLQRRALDKATDPGKLDTLAGGLVAADEPLDVALERETWEEAGVRWPQVKDVRKGEMFVVQCPIDERIGGYMIEQCHWYTAQLADDVLPVNQDGEVAEFVLLSPEDMVQAMLAGDCAAEAALIFARVMGMETNRSHGKNHVGS